MDKRLQSIITEMGNDALSKIERLASNNREEKIAALDSIDEAFEHYGFSWNDVATILSQYPNLIHSDAASQKPRTTKNETRSRMQDGEWRESSTGTGSVVGILNGIRCTIFKSKKNDGTYGAVANIDADNQEWHRDFTSIEEAQETLTKIYANGAT